jgi:hypothetical protein
VWKVRKQIDNRGNEVKIADPDDYEDVTIWVFPQRSARAEVHGQQSINVTRIGVPGHFVNLDLWARLQFQGKDWDVVTPPSYHHGTRHVRHWTIDVRERPNPTPGGP